MEIEQRNKIYDRLLGINFKIEIQAVPNPQYINQAIGQCHVFIEEVEHFSIDTKKEISITMQALNNATADYEYSKEKLFTENEEIQNLPNIKDREARANRELRKELLQIKTYKNIVIDLKTLSSAIDLKLKNLNRANQDIKMQLRVLEAHIKLGAGPTTDIAIRSLAEEFQKSIHNEDSFEEAKPELVEEQIMDPSTDLDVANLIKSQGDDSESEPEKPSSDIDMGSLFGSMEEAEKLADPVPEPQPETGTPETITEEPRQSLEELLGVESDSEVPIGSEEPVSPVEEDLNSIELPGGMGVVEIEDTYEAGDVEVEVEENEKNSNVVDLDSVIDFKPEKEEGGSKKEVSSKKERKQDEADPDKKDSRQDQKEEGSINIDELLDNLA